jgi:CubicO group peptidase (beta-lactamase class C family)
MDAPSVLTATVEGGRLTDFDRRSLPVPWWSLTKTAIAAAALALVGGGRLALDEPLDSRPYTLRQLLQHTAGVPEYGALAAYHEAVSRRDAPWSVEELLRRVVADRLLFAPGRGWSYSNVGYLFVRRLIENEVGKRFDTALRRLVFEPLGVPEVTLAREPADLDGTAWGNQSCYHPGWVYHGLAVGTPAEAALFVDRLLAGQLLPAELLRAMLEVHSVGGPIAGRPWQSPGYGLVIMVDAASPRGRCMGHTGGGPGSVAASFHFADLRPTRTVAAFAAVDDPGVVERAVLER